VDAGQRAQQVLESDPVDIDELGGLVDELRAANRTALVTKILREAADQALADRWNAARLGDLAGVLRDHQHFAFARRLLQHARDQDPVDEKLRQQHALCTYKDLELPAIRRFDRALRILQSDGSLASSTDAETLGIAGAIFKRRWEVDAKRIDLECARWCYRRGFQQSGHPQQWYAGINAAFVADQLAGLEEHEFGDAARVAELRADADDIRRRILDESPADDGIDNWHIATLGEAHFGLGEFEDAGRRLAQLAERTPELWRRESTATQLGTLAALRRFGKDERAQEVLRRLLGNRGAAVERASTGKVGLALSGGGFRASLFHIGVLARLAECNVLRHVEVLSCVSGGSIIGAYYYLKLQRLLQEQRDDDIPDQAYVELVRDLADEFLGGVRKNLRGHLLTSASDDARMLFTRYSYTDRAGELLEEYFYGRLRDEPDPWRMPELVVRPAGTDDGFTLRYENWTRAAKVPVLVLNATTLNTGNVWQFTPTWMGEPPSVLAERMDASRRLRRVYYDQTPDIEELRRPSLGTAVAASACVPGLFPPIRITGLYDGISVELVDGGVHDNQGIASLLEQDCTVLLVSDASGQLRDDEDPKRKLIRVLTRSNDVLMKRVRGVQYNELLGRARAGTLRGFMGVHLTKGLPARPRDWIGSEDTLPADDEAAGRVTSPYGIDRGVQRALAELRTDLDAFSDDEAYALMAVGYLMTRKDLADALPDLAAARVEIGDRWPFWTWIDRVTAPDDPAPGLARSLGWGRSRFFRPTRRRLDRLRTAVAERRARG
jgi:predicted acylesterase/phospholipase RssA